MPGIILLAAGSSSRLGSPKQNLKFQGQTLLARTIQAAQGTGFKPMVLVLGANTEAILPQLPEQDLVQIHNPNWQTGMASSIKVGLEKLLDINPTMDSVFILLCDQPFVQTHLLQQMVDAQSESGKGIVACAYEGTWGAPVLFTQQYFPALQELQGMEGAKKILKSFPSDVFPLPFSLGAVDIDTLQDYQNLLQKSSIK